MGAGAFVSIANNSSNSVTTSIPNKNCFFDGGDDGSWLCNFNNLSILANSLYPADGSRVYIEACNSGTCWEATKTFTMIIARHIPPAGDIQTLYFKVSDASYSYETESSVVSVVISNDGDQQTIAITITN